jgi:hypothetical protein
MLEETLDTLRVGETLYTWSGKLLDCRHDSVRADLIRLRLFHRNEHGFLFREIPPYRPAAVYRGQTQSEDLHRMIFSSDPLFLVRAGSRKGRHAHAYDLYRNEDAVRIDLSVQLGFDLKTDELDVATEHALEISASMFDTFAAATAGEPIAVTVEEAFLPEFLLSSKETAQHVYLRTGATALRSQPRANGGYVCRNADLYYGQGVWCVDPADLGVWFVHKGPRLVHRRLGTEVNVGFNNE